MFFVDKKLSSSKELTLPLIQKVTHPHMVRNINTNQPVDQFSKIKQNHSLEVQSQQFNKLLLREEVIYQRH